MQQPTTLTFDTPDEMSAAVSGANVEFTALSNAPYRSSMTAFGLGPIGIQSVIDSPHSARGLVAHDTALLLFMLGPGVTARINSEPILAADVAVLGPGAEFCTGVGAPFSWGTIALSPEDAEALGADNRAQPLANRVGVSKHLLHRAPGLLPAFLGVTRAVRSDPSVLGDGPAAEALAETLREEVRCALMAGRLPDRLPRAVRGRMRTARRLHDFLRAEPSAPVSTAALCIALGVSERSLRDAVAAVHGISLQAYLRLRRLDRARALLVSGPDQPGRVKRAAISCGFLHLGRFAAAYARRFGEPPSATMLR